MLPTTIVCCIHVRDFSVKSTLRNVPPQQVRESPVAILDDPGSFRKMFAYNLFARQDGIVIGMGKREASVVPAVLMSKRARYEQTAHELLIDCAFSFSPRVESTCPGTIIIDLTGTERLLGRQHKSAQRLVEMAADYNLQINIAVASSPDVALYAARGFSGITVINAGQEALKLAGLPVDVLQPDPETLQTLKDWGIHDFQSLAKLPRSAIVERLGQKGVNLQKAAIGTVQRELVPCQPSNSFQGSIELQEPLELLEPLAFVLDRLLNELLERLQRRALATDQVQLHCHLDRHSCRNVNCDSPVAISDEVYQRTLKLPVPTQDGKLLLRLLQLNLAAHPPQGPIKKITLKLLPAKIRFGQANLFQPHALDAVKLEVTLAKLRALVGEKILQPLDAIGFAGTADSYMPDTFSSLPSPPARKQSRRRHSQSLPIRILRRFRPVRAAKVECEMTKPALILFQCSKKSVCQASGPWHSDGLWWQRAGAWSRDIWDVDLSSCDARRFYRIFRDHDSGQWFVEGKYD